MQSNTVKANVNVTDNGTTAKVVKEVKTLKDLLDNTARSANKTGQSAASAAAGQSPSLSAAKSQAQAITEKINYGVERSTGGTGAASRDFAKQAQGLGGLVRVYATFAANIFAVSAAFTALKEAASFERLAKGSEILSVQVGVNLNKVAKAITEATGNAISLQEALKFTNVGVSAGLAGEQIIKLTKIAKGAANLLGRDSTDAITRIIQGTAKQEQEILDELGIFIKANKAYDEYAKKFEIKGGADALSAQQKVLAYAAAVEQAGKKYEEFAAIEDPFSKFTGTAKQALTELLNVANKVFIPILDLIGSSGEAIKGLALIITGTLLKRALPGLKESITEFVTFDSRRVQDEASKQRLVIVQEYAKNNKLLLELKAKQAAIESGSAVSKSSIQGLLTGTVLENRPISSGIIGTPSKPQDLSKITSLLEVENRLLDTLNKQVTSRKDGAATLDKMIKQGIVSKTSTIDNLVLDEKGKQVALQTFQSIELQNKSLAEGLALRKQITAQEKLTNSSKAAVDRLGELNPQRTGSSNPIIASFNNQLSRTAEISNAFTASMGKTYKESIVGFGRAMADAGKEVIIANAAISASSAGMLSLAATSRLAGAAVGVLSIAFRGLVAVVSKLFLPLTILYTIWELFGKQIKQLLGFNTDLEDFNNNIKDISKSWNESLAVASKSLERLQELDAKASKVGSTDDLVKNSGRRLTAIAGIISATETRLADMEAAQAKYELTQRKKSAEATGVPTNEDILNVQKLLKTLELTGDQRQRVLDIETNLKSLEGKRNSSGDSAFIKEAEKRNLLDLLGIVRETEKAQQQSNSSINQYNSNIQLVVKTLDEYAKKQKLVNDPNSIFTNQDIDSAYKAFTDNLTTLKLSSDNAKASATDLVTQLGSLGKAAFTQSAGLAIFANLISTTAKNGGDLVTTLDLISKNPVFLGIVQAAFKEAEERAKNTVKAVKPYSEEARRVLRTLENQARVSASAIKAIDYELSTSNAIEQRTSSILGYGDADHAVNVRRLNDLKAEKQWVTSNMQAEKDYQAVILKRDSEGRGPSREEIQDAKIAQANSQTAATEILKYAGFANQAALDSALITIQLAKNNQELERANQLKNTDKELNQTALDIREAELNYLVNVGDISRATSTSKLAALEQEKIELTRLFAIDQARAALELKRKNARDSGLSGAKLLEADGTATQEAANAISLANNTANAALARLDFATKEKIVQEGITKQLELQAEAMSKLEGWAKSLEDVFGSVGEVFGNLALAIQKSADARLESERKFAQEKKQIQNDVGDDESKMSAITALDAKYKKEQKSRELDLAATAINSTKKLFKEKTLAYKTFSAFEKVIHFSKLAMDTIEITKSAIKSASVIKDTLAVAYAEGKAAVVKAYNAVPPPFNFALAAATAAAITAVLGKVLSGGGSAPGFNMSKEQRQETQGTGTTYNSQGIKVETGGGVFGAADEKSKSITNSLEVIKSTSVEGLTFTSKMVTILQSINDGINGATKSIYSLVGIRTGSQFGTSEGTRSSGINGLFGKTRTTEIADAGIQISGTFNDLINNISSVIRTYEVLTTTTKSSGFLGIGGSTKTNTSANYAALDATVANQISGIFKNAELLFIEAGKGLGLTTQAITDKLGKVSTGNIIASLRDLSGEDLQNELNAIISNILDTASTALFSSLEKYRQFGEGMLETVVRVTDANNKVNDALLSMGKASFDAYLVMRNAATGYRNTAEEIKLLSIDISESLVKSSGGLESFLEKTKFFNDNFLTDAERLAPIQKALTDQMKKLGLESIDTKDEFKNLVLGLDLTIPRSRDLYVSLMEVADAFNTVYSSSEKVLTSEEYRSKFLELEIVKQRLLGNVSKSVLLAREEELKLLMELPEAQEKNLVAAKLVIYTLEDALALRNAEIAVIKAQGNTYQALQKEREVELLALNTELRLTKQLQYAAEDAAKTADLNLELMELQGRSSEVLNARRVRELKSLSAADAALKIRIFRLQDETALLQTKSEQEVKIYNLLGKSEEALRITREKELKALDPQLQASQVYIYALEDEAALKEKLVSAREQEKSAINNTITSLKNYLEVLKDYKIELLGGDKSTLTPQQKYNELKQEALRLASIASSTAVTEAEIEARDRALDKLPSATDSWLEASRTLYASSQAYTSDFNQVLSIIDSAAATVGLQQSEAAKQLEAITTSNTFLDSIDTNTKEYSVLLSEYLEAQKASESVKTAAIDSGSIASGSTVGELSVRVAEVAYETVTDAFTPIQESFAFMAKRIEDVITQAYSPGTGTVTNINAEMLLELVNLKKEVSLLREDQANQTAELIINNFLANAKGAETVSNTIIELDGKKNFTDRNLTGPVIL